MPVIDQCLSDRYAIYHADCMEVLPTLAAESVGLSVYSPPFPELYQYSDDPRDMTNCTSYAESIEQYRFVVGQVARATLPGRLSCVHCTDLRHGAMYQRDFPGDIIRVHEDAGMRFFCRVTIWKDPWEFARRTRMKSLMHKTVSVTDSSTSRIAPADYLLVFKKVGQNPQLILHPEGFRHYVGGEQIPPDLMRDYGSFRGDPRENLLSHWIWRHYASPVWMDIRRGRLLPFRQARESVEEKHVCPLQLDVIDRCLTLWSNPGDVVLSPFMGVGSEVYEAVRMGRLGVGAELKATYYRQALRNVQHAAEHVGLDEDPISMDEVDPESDVDGEEDLTTEGTEEEVEDAGQDQPQVGVNTRGQTGTATTAGEQLVDGDQASTHASTLSISASLPGSQQRIDDSSVPSVPSVVNERDELFEQAKALVRKEGRGSVALLQRKLAIGYGRATRLIEQLVADCIVGEFVGTSSCRAVLDPADVAQVAQGVAVPASMLASGVDGNHACGRAMQPSRPEER